MSDPIRYLTVEDVLRIRDRLAQQYGDSFDVLRFQQLLSALATPQQSLFGEEIFPTLCAKAGMLLTALVRNHPFWDGNKRIALAATVALLERNGYTLSVDQAEADRFTTRLATGDEAAEEARAWVERHSRPLG
ncbi:MAG TPA: type II toxin-antitoxin system death-on-curing family toxin [Herpetosiphonaceae bacterium]|nr:type II toxin-antitoxin system death-on-curing family toxin [Herpetosiphonaceae bacterium]